MIKPYKEEIINIRNDDGSVIHCVYNYRQGEENKPLIIVPSQYEKTIRNNLTLMLYLVNNGFDVFRYDNRNHNGNSTGNIINFTLSSAYDDFSKVLDYINADDRFKGRKKGALGISISARVLYQYLGNNKSGLDVAITLVGVVDIQETLNAIVNFDSIQAKKNNPNDKLGVHKILSYEIDWDNFVEDAISCGMDDIHSAKEAISRIDIPLYIIVAERDKWVKIETVKEVFGNNVNCLAGTYEIENSGHELYKNPASAKIAQEKIVELYLRFFDIDYSSIIAPDIREVIEENKKERWREKNGYVAS